MTKILGLTLAAAGMMTITAQAIPIAGSIDIGAYISHVNINKTLNTVDFVDDNLAPGNALVNNATGGFVPYILSVATYTDFSYNPLVVANPLWTLVLGGASFDLLAITSVDEVGVGLVLTGNGLIHATGYTPTRGKWSFSSDSTGGANFTFSSQTSAVPDGGGTLVLLGSAIMGLFGLGRKSLRNA